MQDAKEGVFKDIGDGLRRHPELFVPFDRNIGIPQVLKGTSAYIQVNLYNFQWYNWCMKLYFKGQIGASIFDESRISTHKPMSSQFGQERIQ